MTKKSYKDDKEYMSIVSNLLDLKEVQDLDNYKHHMLYTRLEHSIDVSYYSYKKAKKLNLDYKSCARGGLLHDLFFYDTKTSKISNREHLSSHPKIALANAKRITTINEIEEDIILKHMYGVVGDAPKYKESWIVCYQDKATATKESRKNLYSFGKVLKDKIIN